MSILTKNETKMGTVVIIAVGFLMLVSQAQGEESTPLKEKRDKIGYALGADIGTNMKNLSIEINADMVAQGMKDALAGKKLELTDEEMRATLTELNKNVQSSRDAKRKTEGEKNKAEGERFLKENAGKTGVVTLPSGLQYKIMKEGKGKTPKNGDTVIVNYRGAFTNGEEFDSSYARKQPGEFIAGQLVPGMNEALLKMKEGSRWLVVLPSNLAYGEKGVGPIGPNMTLMFDLEVVTVKSK